MQGDGNHIVEPALTAVLEISSYRDFNSHLSLRHTVNKNFDIPKLLRLGENERKCLYRKT
jgi:hypothetical protein